MVIIIGTYIAPKTLYMATESFKRVEFITQIEYRETPNTLLINTYGSVKRISIGGQNMVRNSASGCGKKYIIIQMGQSIEDCLIFLYQYKPFLIFTRILHCQ